MEIFGYKISRKLKDEQSKGETFATPRTDDGAIEIESLESSGVNYNPMMGYSFDLDNIPSDEYELIRNYRELSLQPDIDEAIQEIVNEAIITDEMKQSVSIVLDELELSDNIKEKIRDEFDHVLKMLKFKTDGYGLFRKWYVDGKLYIHKVVDKSNSKKGIIDLIDIDPLNIKMVRELKKKMSNQVELYDLSKTDEYFLYSQKQFTGGKETNNPGNVSAVQMGQSAIKIAKESIAYIPSGLVSADAKMVLSHLYKSIKPYNNLRLLEDSVVVYRVSRAPERRIFYVDVGNLPKGKAEQYMNDVINRFKTNIVYDVAKGTITNRKKFQSMMEDYWLPRREGGKGTEVTTLPGGDNLGELGDVDMFRTKLYKSLNVPLSRFQQDSTAFNLGRTSEITRDEIKFSKFINRLRKKFSVLFNDILKTQLILKNIITREEWDDISDDISYDFLEDNYFQELKQSEILRDRLETLETIQRTEIIGKYYSHDYIRREILKQTEEEIKEEDKKIAEEEKDPKWAGEEGDFGVDSNDFEDEQPAAPQPVTIVEPEDETDKKANPINTGNNSKNSEKKDD